MRILGVCMLLFVLFLSGCASGEGKILSDFLQHLLSQDIWLRWIVSIILVFLLAQTLRIVWLLLRVSWQALVHSHRFIFGWSRRNVIGLLMLGTVLWFFSNNLIDFMQDIEQRYMHPVYVNAYNGLTEEHLTAIYEDALGKQVDPYHKQIIIQRTREIAAKIQSIPLCIYEAAYLECGLNPFTVRSDQVAAGWIQFTRIGLGGLKLNGKQVTFDQVLQACASKDITFMMDLTELYLVDKYIRAGRQPLNNTIDLYLALFAPVLIGAPSDKIVYQGYQNPSYYKNDGLDGWYVAPDVDGRNQIFHKLRQKDGKITIYEIFLALESKKARLINQYLK
ncbi:MAG: hypothetical protein NW218_13230 [Saprospiraceae bacterium]|nr:hypothetical protein [Saprospiraceae bacterium]